jgi:Ion channel
VLSPIYVSDAAYTRRGDVEQFKPFQLAIRRYLWPFALVWLWTPVFVGPRYSGASWILIGEGCLVLMWVSAVINSIVLRLPVRTLIINVVVALLMLIAMFDGLYYGVGTKANFNKPLSKLDAMYFTVGTLTTAGTGNLVATGETSRALQLTEMVSGALLIVGGVGAVIGLAIAPPRAEAPNKSTAPKDPKRRRPKRKR